ncbi:NTF2-like N-terminal transpeptidase domain-containing protein [Gordonia malaquae]|uniref:NTF2-like N-terminal transpeptidase domain-containing protein n=1 Tax=Gordonia malaquae TaxID=410332 RepID=UPI0030FE4F76
MAWRGTRTVSAAAAVVVAVGVVSACGSEETTDAGRVAGEFADAVERLDVQTASTFTSAPAQASEALAATISGMDPQSVSTSVDSPVEYSDGTASFTMKTTWRWQDESSYATTTSGTVRKLSSGWKVQWDPNLLFQGLPAGARLQRIRTDAKPAPTVDSRTGKPFMQMEPVNEITFDPSAAGKKVDAAISALSASIRPIAPLITARTIRDEVDRAQGQPIIAVTLRDEDMKVLASDPERITGVTVRRTGRLVMNDRRLESPLEVGLTNYWNAIRDATAGWQVQLAAPGAKPRRLAGQQGPPGKDVATSIDQNQQLVLGDSVVDVAQPATMMVFDSMSGGILAMAQNDAAAASRVEAGLGYATGSTLKPVFDAITRAVPGAQDDTREANDVLHHLGLGVTFVAPGVSLPRQVSPTVSTARFSPNDFTASILNMGALGVALARADAGKDKAVPPFVIKGATTKVSTGDLGTLDRGVAKDVLAQMSTIARKGDASDITGAPGLRALVGTNGPKGPGWFVGLQGGKVIVVYCEGDKSGTAALQVAQKYFRVSKS